jgi:hypothetical protein
MIRKLLSGGILTALLLLTTGPAEARGVDARFLLDAAPGLTVPIADNYWRGYGGPSFKFSLRVGAELWFAHQFGIAGEVDLDPEPLILSNHDVVGRVRGLVGFRLLFGFRVGAFFIRHAIGVDYVGTIETAPNRLAGEAALAVEPGVGVQFRFIRHGVVGFLVDFPIGFFYHLAADVQFLGFLGVRI